MEIQRTAAIPSAEACVPPTACRKAEDGGKRAAPSAPERDTFQPERDTFQLSEQAEEWLNRAGTEAPSERPESSGEDSAESITVGGSVGINAAKLARMLAVARTKAQIRAVIAQIQQDLKECESGRAQGMEVDEASVRAAENLLNQARQRMGQARDGEASPEEEAAFSLAALF